MTERDKLPPLERYIRILELLAAFPSGMSLTDVARILELPKTSAHRLLRTLQESDLVEVSNGAANSYVLGKRIARIAHLGSGTEWVATLVRPHLKELAAETGETCYLAKLDGIHITSILMEAPDTPWRGFVLPGKGMAPHAAASAKAIMAFQDSAIVSAALEEALPKLTARTKTSRSQVLAEYAQVRKRGYAECIGEIDEELAALAVPVFIDPIGVIFSVGVTGPLLRITDKQSKTLVQTMKRCGGHISNALSIGFSHRASNLPR